jgi:hypothetical protein
MAQHDLDRAELTVTDQVVSDPTPDSVQLRMVTNSHNPSIFRPTLDEFRAALFLENTEPNIKPFGYITIPKLYAARDAEVVVSQPLEIVDMDQFIAYNTLVTQSEKYRVALRGKTKLHLGGLPVVTVNFNKAVEVKGKQYLLGPAVALILTRRLIGLNSLKGFRVENMTISLKALPGQPNMEGTLIIPNPSPMTLTLGDVVQELFVDNQRIGNTTINNLTLKPGDNSIPMSSVADQAVVIKLISSKYKNGTLPIEARTVSIMYNNKTLPYFQAAMQATPLYTNLDVGPALKAAGVDISVFSNPVSSAPSGSGTSTTSATSSAATAPSTTSVTPPASSDSSLPPPPKGP